MPSQIGLAIDATFRSPRASRVHTGMDIARERLAKSQATRDYRGGLLNYLTFGFGTHFCGARVRPVLPYGPVCHSRRHAVRLQSHTPAPREGSSPWASSSNSGAPLAGSIRITGLRKRPLRVHVFDIWSCQRSAPTCAL